MENNQDPFDSIFEGIDLPEDFAAKLKKVFDDAVDEKLKQATKGVMKTEEEEEIIHLESEGEM